MSTFCLTIFIEPPVDGSLSHPTRPVNHEELTSEDKSVGQNSSNGAAMPVAGPKRNWRSALHDASRSGHTAEVPTGLGVRARQRRFPARARPFVQQINEDGTDKKGRLPIRENPKSVVTILSIPLGSAQK